MTLICNACGYDQTPDNSEFCEVCGAELSLNNEIKIEKLPIETQQEINNNFNKEIETFNNETNINEPENNPFQVPLNACLIAKQNNAPVGEFNLEEFNLIGIFDPDTGPVEIDLEGFMGSETVSRQHAEIYQESGVWKIKDNGSTNGVFIKPQGQKRFNARITSPTIINNGDEIAIAKIRFLFKTE